MRPLLVLTALLLAAPSAAQTPTPVTAPVDSATMKAARELLVALGSVEMFIANAERQMTAMRNATGSPLPPEFYERLMEDLRKNAPQLMEEMAGVYARHMRKDELEGLTRFYSTPLGRSYSAKQGEMLAETTQIGIRWGQAAAQRTLSEMPHAGTPPTVITTPP